jgi:hypothetical protein
MATLQVLPRPTPAERADRELEIDVEPRLTELAQALEDWTTPRQSWEVTLHEGHEFGRANNVEAQVLFASGEQTSSIRFRLDQLDRVDDTGEELVLVFEERDGIAKLARCTATGLDVDLHHILTFT